MRTLTRSLDPAPRRTTRPLTRAEASSRRARRRLGLCRSNLAVAVVVALESGCAASTPLRVPEPHPQARATSSPALEDTRDVDDDSIERRTGQDSEELRELHDAELGADGDVSTILPGLPELDHDADQLRAEYDIPIDVNDAVVKYVRFFQSPEVRPLFARWLSRLHRYGPRYAEILREAGLPEDTVFLAMIESGFANLATSRARAVGPWQFMAATAKSLGLRRDHWVDERRDPEKAATAAARFLARLHRETGDWRLAWAAYNAGPGRIRRARKRGYSGFWEMARAKGVLPAETGAYVPKIMAAAIIARHATAFGFGEGEVVPERWIEYEEVTVREATKLSSLAAAAGVSVDALLDLNPELRRTMTPPRPYALKLPRASAQRFAETWQRLSTRRPRDEEGRPRSTPAATARVEPGETLWSIARRIGVSVRDLASWNGIPDPERHILPARSVIVLRPPDGATRPVALQAAGVPSRGRAAPAREAKQIRIRRGDTLWSVARRFGVDVADVAAWNAIHDPSGHVLRAGQLLRVYARPSVADASTR